MNRSRVLAAVLGAVVLFGLSTPATATAKPSPKADPAVAAALSRIGANTFTGADIALVRSNPDLAAVVVDPSRTTTTTSAVSRSAVDGAAIQDYCGYFWVDRTFYSTVGWVLFTWRHYVEGCIDGFVTTRWKTRMDFLTQADGTVVFNGLVTDWATSPGGYTMTSMRQRYIQQCVVTYGCYANYYPWSSISLNSNGQWNWSAG
jgi:hypothetical protein